jgi:hypothetical protein
MVDRQHETRVGAGMIAAFYCPSFYARRARSRSHLGRLRQLGECDDQSSKALTQKTEEVAMRLRDKFWEWNMKHEDKWPWLGAGMFVGLAMSHFGWGWCR